MLEFILQKLGIIPCTNEILPRPSNLPFYLICIENILIFFLIIFYYFIGVKITLFRIILFIAFAIIPDISLLGYFFGMKTGSFIYNIFHFYPITLLILVIGYFTKQGIIIDLSLIWIAHIAQDRARGFGFKYLNSYKKNYMNNI